MSIPEVSHRLARLVTSRFQRLGGLRALPVITDERIADAPVWVHASLNDHSVIEVADRVVAGRLDVFAIRDYDIGAVPQWNRDPKTGVNAPLDFGKTLDYRNSAIVGDVKYLWEPARHLHLVTLAQAFALTDEQEYLNCIRLHLDSWFDQCPYLQGPHWSSSLELGIRLINWSITWQLVGGSESQLFMGKAGKEFRDRWLTSVYQHAHFIHGHYSRFTSANNHLIGESAGVFVAAQTWPYWSEIADWEEKSLSILETEAVKQNFSDGVNKEQAISYQQFVLDFLLFPLLAAKANSKDFSATYLAVMERMLEYIASLLDVAGNVPMIGDADDGYAVRLTYSSDFCPFRSLLATGAVLFSRPEFKLKSGTFDSKSIALLGAQGAEAYTRLKAEKARLPVKTSFPEGGYFILGGSYESPDEVKMVVDAGPLGYGGIAAHGHADALAVYLSVAGREILIDPGTFAYHTEQKWRDYFRGTSAHNTIRIDGMNQSEIGGNFMWLRKAEATLESFEDNGEQVIFRGSHRGYEQGANPVSHKREIIYHRTKRCFDITDTLEINSGDFVHLVDQFWHFSENCSVEQVEGNVFLAISDDVAVEIKLDERLKVDVHKADEETPLGWVSRKFDAKVPGITLDASSHFERTLTLRTRLSVVGAIG
ncbi:alginate lyase family protein [Halieaceae bacterium IMCC14734]|uniref:Alginate lyase family protein n=1 Tax=Candidatus Litorirhabdus singularis TaxID=2518993 RepID=A0ABT3THT5_9GAMM|nr:alginate lyase family protein [Candidatus Litorirhabdus singularis]MCX2980984.1 alginate lyase family protein [Candidatus Litorirhabdus singularis]